MSGAPEVEAFLRSIGAGAGPSASADKPAANLPFSAQHSLIATQVEALESRLAQTLAERRGEIAAREAKAAQVRREAARLQADVLAREREAAGDDRSTQASLTAYTEAIQARDETALLLSALTALVPAVQAFEALEADLEKGSIDASTLGPRLEAARAACANLGHSRSAKGKGVQRLQAAASPTHAWLQGSAGVEAPAAVWYLGKRLNAAEESISKVVKEAWAEAVHITPCEDGSKASVTLAKSVKVRQSTLSLAQLLGALEQQQALEPAVRSLANALLREVFKPALSAVDTSRGGPWQAQREVVEDRIHIAFSRTTASAESSPTSLTAIGSLLRTLEEVLLLSLPSEGASLASMFKRTLVTGFSPAISAHLQSCLPSSRSPIWDSSRASALQGLAESATSFHALLQELGYLMDEEVQEESEVLLRWAGAAGKQCSRRLADGVRAEARKLLLAEGDLSKDAAQAGLADAAPVRFEDGWTAVAIEIEAEVDLQRLTGATAEEDERREEADVDGQLGSQDDDGAEWGWGDAAETSAAEVAKPVAARSASVVPPARTASPASSAGTPSSTSHAPKKPKGKAALGGVRIVKPATPPASQPQPPAASAVISAPEPEAEAWGLDDDLTSEPATTSSASASAPSMTTSASSHSAGAPEIDFDIDDDAWGLSEEEIAAKRASMRGVPAGFDLAKFAAEQDKKEAIPEGKEDDEAPNKPAAVPAAPVAPAVEGEDGWGLDDDIEVPSEVPAPAGEAEDGDAWGLSTTPPKESALPVDLAPTSKVEDDAASVTALPPPTPEPERDEQLPPLEGKADDEDDPWDDGSLPDLDVPPVATPPTATPALPSATAPAARSLSPASRLAASSTTGTASPQLRQATLRNAVAAAGTSSPKAAPPSTAAEKQPTQPSGPPKERCAISSRSVALVALLNKTLDDAEELLQAASSSASSPALRPEPSHLVAAFGDVVDEFRALMPVAHAEILNNVPALAMQFANDCTYVARQLGELQGSLADKEAVARAASDAKSPVKLDLARQATLTTALGQRIFESQMLTQERLLNEAIDEARGFHNVSDEERFAECSRSLKQVLHTLKQLAKVWGGVLGFSTLLASLGRLVNCALQRVVADVIALEDIAEVESEKLAELVKSLGELEALFVDPASGKTAVAIFVPSWFKASYLSEILLGSLKDIEWLLDTGALLDYTPRELNSLVRALFAETPKRAALLERIINGQ